jgi:hypothetical protein
VAESGPNGKAADAVVGITGFIQDIQIAILEQIARGRGNLSAAKVASAVSRDSRFTRATPAASIWPRCHCRRSIRTRLRWLKPCIISAQACSWLDWMCRQNVARVGNRDDLAPRSRAVLRGLHMLGGGDRTAWLRW